MTKGPRRSARFARRSTPWRRNAPRDDKGRIRWPITGVLSGRLRVNGREKAASTPRTRTPSTRCSTRRSWKSSPSSRSVRSTTEINTSTAWTTGPRCGVATKTTRSTPRSATGCGTVRPVRSCAGSSCLAASRCWRGALPRKTRAPSR